MLRNLNLKKTNQKGFTIIEVLIVLAIAGLILLIVFLAVPGLQRGSRNTQRKNDVAALLGAVSEFSNNNNGKIPTTCTGTSPATFDTIPAGTSSQAKVGYYNQGCATGAATVVGHVGMRATYGVTGPYNTAAQDYVTIVPGATCSTATAGQTAAGAARQFAAVYEIENGGGTFAPVCQES